MSEPVSTSVVAKYSSEIAGFAGSLIGLSFLKEMTAVQWSLALFGGNASATYLTPFVRYWFNIDPEMRDSIAFIVGIFSMAIITVLFRVIALIGEDPIGAFKKLTNRE